MVSFQGLKLRSLWLKDSSDSKTRGAVAVWAPTALSYTSGHSIVMQALYKAIFQDGQYGLGAATTAAKIAAYSQSSYWSELVETYVLFGDPVTHLGVDVALSVISPNGGETVTSGATYTIQWEAPSDMIKFTLGYSMNNGRTWKKIADKVEGTSYGLKVPVVKRV